MHGIEFIEDFAVVMLVAGLVGWFCQRIGLSVIVGYLVAGMVIGPYTPPFALVHDIGRIETLSQMGLVFLMFSIGMKLSLRKLRKLGIALVVSTALQAVVIYQLMRVAGGALGLGATETVFLGAMLMISSSAVISKVLADIGATHEKVGQMAMGVSLVEDVIAVMLLTGLSSYASLAGAGHHSATIGQTMMLLTAFVVLVAVLGVLFVPWLLRKLSLTGGAELPTLVQAGLLFILATAAERAGFSLALGAFLLGAIVADTPQRTQVDRTFEGLRDVFSAVFFVAIGMLIDVGALADSWLLVLTVSALALGGRALASGTGLLLTGSPTREAVRVGLLVVPVGEFTFIIAQLGINGGVLPRSFQVVAVGVALLTTLAAPILARRSVRISEWCGTNEPRWLRAWLKYYRDLLDRLEQQGRKNMLWQLCKKRVIQITVEVLLVTGLLAFSGPLFGLVERFLPPDWPFPHGPLVLFWTLLLFVILAPVLAIWRNLAALAMIIGEASTVARRQSAKLAHLIETAIKVGGGTLLFVWLTSFLPLSGAARWLPIFVVGVVFVAIWFFRSKLIYWHSMLEAELQERLAPPTTGGGTAPPWLAPHADWQMALTECVLPDLVDCSGKMLGELSLRSRFGCTVAGVERQGVLVENPPATFSLYPRDRVLLLGDPKQTAQGKAFLGQVSGRPPASGIDEVRMEIVNVPRASHGAGRSLMEIAPSRQFGVQVAGINRGGMRILNPGGDEKIQAFDEILVLGGGERIARFRSWIAEEEGGTEGGT